MKQRIVLVGAGSAQFGYGMIGDVLGSKELEGSTIVLHDINPETLGEVGTTAKGFTAEKKLPFTIESTTDRKVAFKGADFIIISIEVGDRFTLWEQDRTIPQQYGINQIYGENGGPGGLFHALRIIPPILEICEDIERICPTATVFCYSNPMTAICTTVQRVYPDLTFIGLCHEIASLRNHLPVILDTDYDNLDITAGGLNHFSVVLEATYRDSGKDAYPDILGNSPAYFERLPGYSELWEMLQENSELDYSESSRVKERMTSVKSRKPWADRGLFKRIIEDFDLLPITHDSHFGEYIGWAHDVTDQKGIIDFLVYYDYLLSQPPPGIDLTLSERVVPIIEGIITDAGYTEEAVNLPNNGLVAELPEFVAVEVPGLVDRSGIHGQSLPPLPKGYAALLRNYVGVYDLTAEAVIHRSKKSAVQALLVNPVVNKASGVKELVDLMISLQPEWLGYLEDGEGR